MTDTSDPRTMAQMRHEVLLGLITAGFEAVESTLPKSSRTNIVAMIDIRDLETGRGATFLAGSDEPVSALTVQEKLCDAGHRRLILGSNGQILRLGTEIRLFQPAQRLAISIRDGGCVFPGCTSLGESGPHLGLRRAAPRRPRRPPPPLTSELYLCHTRDPADFVLPGYVSR